MSHGVFRMEVKLTFCIWNLLLFRIIIISRKKNHTVVEWFFLLKTMNYITYTTIVYSITSPLSVFYLILLLIRLSVQPESHNALFRINYIIFYHTTWPSLSSNLSWGSPMSWSQGITFQCNIPMVPNTQRWASRPSLIPTASGWLNSPPPIFHRQLSQWEAIREIIFLHSHW